MATGTKTTEMCVRIETTRGRTFVTFPPRSGWRKATFAGSTAIEAMRMALDAAEDVGRKPIPTRGRASKGLKVRLALGL